MEKGELKQKLVEEITIFSTYFLLLFIFFNAFGLYRHLILKEHAIDYYNFSFNAIESLVLAKVIFLGQKFNLGERFSGRPLIIPTLYKTVVFTFLVLLFTVFEEVLRNFFHGKTLQMTYQEILSSGLYEILARLLVMVFFFFFFFAFLQIGQELGDHKLFKLFFQKKDLR